MDIAIWDGIIIGGAGGSIAGLAVWLFDLLNRETGSGLQCAEKAS